MICLYAKWVVIYRKLANCFKAQLLKKQNKKDIIWISIEFSRNQNGVWPRKKILCY